MLITKRYNHFEYMSLATSQNLNDKDVFIARGRYNFPLSFPIIDLKQTGRDEKHYINMSYPIDMDVKRAARHIHS